MNCHVFPVVTTDLEWEDAIYPESGICPDITDSVFWF